MQSIWFWFATNEKENAFVEILQSLEPQKALKKDSKEFFN